MNDGKKAKNQILKVTTFPVQFPLGENQENITINTPSKPSEEQIIKQAIDFHLQGNICEAEKSYKYCINQGFNSDSIFSNYAMILKDQGQLEEAKILTIKAIKINPDIANHHFLLGNILKDLGKLTEAEISIRKAIDIDPNFTDAHNNLGSILIDLDNSKEAEISLRKAIKLNPSLAIAHSNLGSILIDHGNLKEAEIFIRKALNLNPASAEAHSNLGSLFAGLGKLKDAEISIRKAIELKPKKALSHIKLGRILDELGQTEEANIHEWKAVELNTISPLLNTYRENAQIINKTAFLVFSCSMFNQLKPVIEINPDAFEILVPDDVNNRVIQKICNNFKLKGIRIRKANEVISNNLIYKKLVSIHGDDEIGYLKNENNVQTKTIVPTIKLLGKKNIRFMYTAGKNKYTILSYWNKYYDGILCYGPYHEDKFKHKHKIATSQMGYPRFDKYFKPGFERNYLIEKFKCDPKKKTIVWLPTWTSLSSIDKYHKVISSLRIDHNIVVKPHPSMKKSDPESYKKLFSVDFNYVDDNEDDNVQLYALADLMLFDYGGPMFGALYLNKNMAFLEMNLEAKNHYYLGKISSEDYLKSFFPKRIATLKNLKSICHYCLDNPPSENLMKSLKEEFFNTRYQGDSAKRAYNLILSNEWLSQS